MKCFLKWKFVLKVFQTVIREKQGVKQKEATGTSTVKCN